MTPRPCSSSTIYISDSDHELSSLSSDGEGQAAAALIALHNLNKRTADDLASNGMSLYHFIYICIHILLLLESQSPKPATPKKKKKGDKSKSKPESSCSRGRPRKNPISSASMYFLQKPRKIPYIFLAKPCSEQMDPEINEEDALGQGMFAYSLLFTHFWSCLVLSEITVDLRLYKYTNATEFNRDLKKRTANATRIWTVSIRDPFDTFNAQLLVRAEKYFQPTKIAIEDYNMLW